MSQNGKKIPAKVFGNPRIDLEYKNSPLTQPGIALFKAIDRDLKDLAPASAKFNMSLMLKSLTCICPSMLTTPDWEATLAGEPEFRLGEDRKLIDEDNPARALKGVDYYGNEKPLEANAFIKRNAPFQEHWLKILKLIDASDLSPRAKHAAGDFLNESYDKLERNYAISVALDKEHFFDDWAKGEFHYKEPIFQDAAEQQYFGNVLKVKLLHFIPSSAYEHPDKEHQIVIGAVDAMMEKVAEHEGGLRQQAEAEAEREKERAAHHIKRQQEKDDRTAAKAAEATALFMSKHQPYSLGPLAGRAIERLKKQKELPSAEWLNAAIIHTHATLDIREPQAKTLGNLVLTEENISACAAVLELHTTAPADTAALNDHAAKLADITRDNTQMQQLVDSWLTRDDSTLMLAALTLPPAVYADYAKAVVAEPLRTHTMEQARQQLAQTYDCSVGEADDFAKNAPADEADALPLRTAQAQLEAAKHIDLAAARTQIATHIREAMSGQQAPQTPVIVHTLEGKPADLNLAPVALLKATASEGGSTPRQDWLKEMGDSFRWKASDNQGYIHVSHSDFPGIGSEIALAESDASFHRMLVRLTNEVEHKRLNIDAIPELQKLGFSKPHDNRIDHPQYGITVVLNGPETENAKALREARTAFEKQVAEQAAMIELATTLTIPPPADGYAQYMTAPQRQSLQDSIDEAKRSAAKAAETPPPPPAPIPEEKIWRPEPGKTLVILDASASKFAASRDSSGRTWADMLKATASLPNVIVVIPAMVADWEMQGKVPEFNKDGSYKKSELIDMRYADGRHEYFNNSSKIIDDITEDACRVRLVGTNGHRTPVIDHKGKNSNIIVMDTPEDKDVWREIKALQRDLEGDEARFYGELNEKVRKHGHGEKAINRIVSGLPCKAPMMIISDDIRYLEGTNSPPPPSTTPQGAPVGAASFTSYLRAHTSDADCCSMLQEHLQDPNEVSRERIEGDLVNYWGLRGERRTDIIFPYNKSGYGSDGRAGDTITRLVGKGVRALKGHSGAGDEGAGAPPPPGGDGESKWTQRRAPSNDRGLGTLEDMFRNLGDPPSGGGGIGF